MRLLRKATCLVRGHRWRFDVELPAVEHKPQPAVDGPFRELAQMVAHLSYMLQSAPVLTADCERCGASVRGGDVLFVMAGA